MNPGFHIKSWPLTYPGLLHNDCWIRPSISPSKVTLSCFMKMHIPLHGIYLKGFLFSYSILQEMVNWT